ncbi:hypothetical protein AB395_0000726 [Sinorhizobium fredii CCBAU 45436]|nr:hypothetical protein AB395_0000726 [Sinorhizobium fredii CCBAU 45436]
MVDLRIKNIQQFKVLQRPLRPIGRAALWGYDFPTMKIG